MIAVITEKYTICPNCMKKVWRGIRRFGPPTMTCKKCGCEFDTYLKDWNTMSSGRKIWYIFLEWFFPSYYRGFGFPENFLIYFFHIFMVAIPFMPISLIALSITGTDPSAIIGGLIFLLFPVLHFFWVRARILECKRYRSLSVNMSS